MSRHRPLAPNELESKFRRPVEPKVEHRLSLSQQEALEEALFYARSAHQSVHGVSFTLQEAIAFQTYAGRHTARQQLQAMIKSAELALDLIEES